MQNLVGPNSREVRNKKAEKEAMKEEPTSFMGHTKKGTNDEFKG